ncbi:MAG TPA: flagellar basal body P-ring formation chaperone FlgA [Burkholderiaceae bacterium]
MDTRPAPSIRTALARTCQRGAGVVATLALALAAPFAWAQATLPADPGSALGASLEQQVRQLALNGTHAAAPGTPRIEVSVGQLDSRLRLAPCQHVEPYVPEGIRLWGKSRIGLRCTEGAVKWNVYLPITVKVFGTALVATGGLPAGSVLTATDVTPAEVDLAEDSSAPVADPGVAVGRTLARALAPGQSLRLSSLKVRQWFAAGETVTVIAQGNGFSVAGEAQALNNGIEGQPVRVRTEGGRVLIGQPVGERRVELAL